MAEVIDAARGLTLDDARENANVRDAIEGFDVESRKSKDLAEREARLESECYVAWKKAREASDFEAYASILQDMFALKREVAATMRPDVCAAGEPYDGALDAFERGMIAQRLDSIFAATREGLDPLLKAVLAKKRATPEIDALHPALAFDHPGWKGSVEKQAKLSRRVATDLGFDFTKGRFDVSTHPFTGGACPTDVRITTRYSDGNWLEGFAGTVREVGHALYEQGRACDAVGDGLPVSKALSMGTHESQSLLWERMVLQSRSFWIYATPLCGSALNQGAFILLDGVVPLTNRTHRFHEAFPHTKDASPEDFYRAVNRVQPGLIRVEADELSYPFHVFLRYDVERALFAGELYVATIPQKWNAFMKERLDVDVSDDASGVLQDIHWSFGAVGYSPSYTLGAIVAAQIYAAAEDKLPGLSEKISKGEFAPLREWLRTEIHEVGSTYASPDDLLRSVTGDGIDPKPFLDYLRAKYSELYGLN